MYKDVWKDNVECGGKRNIVKDTAGDGASCCFNTILNCDTIGGLVHIVCQPGRSPYLLYILRMSNVAKKACHVFRLCIEVDRYLLP
jgi:hypothetical protein